MRGMPSETFMLQSEVEWVLEVRKSVAAFSDFEAICFQSVYTIIHKPRAGLGFKTVDEINPLACTRQLLDFTSRYQLR